MSAFTLPTSWTTAQSLSGANEIVLAYSERRQSLGQSAVSNLSAGADAQDKTLWLAMQTWLESNCTSFVDHINGPLNSGSTAFLYFTLATWRSAAGLNASGFRRSTDGTTMAYGNIQAGDVWGPWVFEDLQKGFAALKWNVWPTTFSGQYRIGRQSFYADWDNAKSAALTNFNDAIPYAITTPFTSNSWGQYQYISSFDGWFYNALLGRAWGNLSTLVPIFTTRTCDVYVVAEPIGGNTDSFDLLGDFSASEGVMTAIHSFGSSTTLELIFSIGSDSAPPWCSIPNAGESSTRGYKITSAAGLAKYDFTNS